MNSPNNLTMQHKNLVQQGYQSYTPEQLKQIDWGLRFTPAVCSLIAIYGLVVQSPTILFFVAALGIIAFFFPANHPMDIIYNKIVCKVANSTPLPPNPLQRRLACFAAGIMNTAAALFFLAGLPIAAFITGGMLMVLQAIVIFTHFCTLSWMYEKLLRALGMWDKPIELEEAKKLIEAGALVIDVRGPDEFSNGHIECAINFPLDSIELQLEALKENHVLLYCASGARSQIAKQKLLECGLINVFDLGSKKRASELF
jgi:rhodanese-related sulfurtransferase